MFDDDFVLAQLQSSGMLAYYRLFQVGFPIKIPVDIFFEKVKAYLKPNHENVEVKNCCVIFLLTMGFECKDFKIGKTEIHFRPGKLNIIDEMNAIINRYDDEYAKKFSKRFSVFSQNSFRIAFKFIFACKFSLLSFSLYS